MSANNQFIEYDDQVYARYKKASIGAVSGIRLHPRTQERVGFILLSSLDNFTIETKSLDFNYDTDILEIYSPEEDRLFRKLNAYLFNSGLLIPFEDSKEEIVTTNALADDDLTELVMLKNFKQFESRINKITSRVTLDRARAVAESKDRPYSYIRAIESRIKVL